MTAEAKTRTGPAPTATNADLRGAVALRLGEADLWLLPERAVWWPAERTLFIADLHLGKAATMRAAALPVPDATRADLSRLSAALERTQAERLIVLGDLLHSRHGRRPEVSELIVAWRSQHAALAVELVRGNHDRIAGRVPEAWRITIHDDPWQFGPLSLRHYPDGAAGKAAHPLPEEQPEATRADPWTLAQPGPALAGHLHPKFRLQHGADSLKLPCFFLREDVLVLPAFTAFVDSAAIPPRPQDRLFLVADGEVMAWAI